MNMISASHNYDNGYIGLVNLELNLPETIEVNGNKLLRKSEFHISLLCPKKIALLIDENRAEEVEAELVKEFLEFIKANPLNSYNSKNEIRLVKKDVRLSLVAIVEVPGVRELFKHLEDKYEVELPVQPTHITIYTLQPDKGIGILSFKELEQESSIVETALKI